MSIIQRLRNRHKAITDLCEIASHIGVFPLDCMMIDANLHDGSARRIERLERDLAAAIDNANYWRSKFHEPGQATTPLAGALHEFRCAECPNGKCSDCPRLPARWLP